MTSVCALVVTRNRKQLLVECLDALLAQSAPLACIVVFDNASSDGTGELLHERGLMQSARVRYARSEVNTGGAGGYAQALALGVQAGLDWLWLMDDDAEPHPEALERLLASPPARERTTPAVCSTIVHSDGTLDPLHRCRLGRFVTPLPASAYKPGGYPTVDCASFVGLLVRAEAARAAGLPRAEFFLGYDDAEYSLRLGRLGRVRLVPESVVTHKLPVGGGELTRRSRFWNRLLGVSYGSSPWRTYWKDLYRIRNLVVMKLDHQGLSRPGLTLLVLGYAAKALLYEPSPWRRIPWLIRFALKGFRRDFTAPSPEEWASSTMPAG